MKTPSHDRFVFVQWIRDAEYSRPGDSQVLYMRVGDTRRMIERINAGRVTYWTSYDIDFAYIAAPGEVVVVTTGHP